MINIKNLTRLTPFFPLNKYYCSTNITPQAEHYTEMLIRAQRRRFLNKMVLSHNKIIINAERRKNSDGVFALKDKGMCPGTLRSLSGKEEDEIDIVMDGKIMKNLMKSQNYQHETVYVKLEGKEYRCIFKKGHMFGLQFIKSVDLQIYEVGKPNKISIPIQVTHATENPYVQQGGLYQVKKKRIDLICYNQEYPMRLPADISYIFPGRCFRVGDFAHFFPPGLLFDEGEDMNRKAVIVKGRDAQEEVYKAQKFKRMKEKQEKGKKDSRAEKK